MQKQDADKYVDEFQAEADFLFKSMIAFVVIAISSWVLLAVYVV